MAEIYDCKVTDCKYNNEGNCECYVDVTIDYVMSGAGFIPTCMDYEEKDNG